MPGKTGHLGGAAHGGSRWADILKADVVAVLFGDAIAPVRARVPSHRMSTVAEVASAVVFLVGPDAANICGTILSVDGGATAV